MLFTRLGYVVARFALVMGVFTFTIGLLIAIGTLPPEMHTWQSGKLIDRGIYTTLFGIALGMLTEIRYALQAPR